MKNAKKFILPVFLVLCALMFAEVRDRATLKTFFQTDDLPTEAQFGDLIDSMALVSELSSGIKDWDSSGVYQLGDMVINGVTFYKRVTIAGNEDPFDTANWQELSPKVAEAIPGANGINFDTALGLGDDVQEAVDTLAGRSLRRFDTVAAAINASDIRDGAVVVTKGYSSIGVGANSYTYRATGRSAATIDGGFGIACNGADDWLEANDKSVANILQFGGGTADDTAIIQAALNSGVPTYFPKFNYTVSTNTSGAAITIPSNTSVYGDGPQSQITFDAPLTYGLRVLGNSDIVIRDLKLIGNGQDENGLSVRGCGVGVQNSTRVIVRNCIFTQWARHGVFIESSHDCAITDNLCYENVVSTANPDVNTDITFSGGTAPKITGNQCYGNHKVSLAVAGNGSVALSGGVVSHNIIIKRDGDNLAANPGEHGMLLSYASALDKDLICNSNYIENCGFAGIYGGQMKNLTIVGNHVVDCGSQATVDLVGGITYVGQGTATITGNTVINWQGTANGGIFALNNSSDEGEVVILGNIIKESTYAGIEVAGNLDNWLVQGNRISTAGQRGILYNAGGGPPDWIEQTSLVISDNVIKMTATASTGIDIDASGSNGTHELFESLVITGNRIEGGGQDSLLAHPENGGTLDHNAGILLHTANQQNTWNGRFTIGGNEVDNFLGGVTCLSYLAARHDGEGTDADGDINGGRVFTNTIKNCRDGFTFYYVNATASERALLPVGGAQFENVTNKSVAVVGRGNAVRFGRLDNGRVRFRASSIPVGNNVGLFRQGDVIEYLAPTAGGKLGAVCVTDGAPGTWKEYGTIAP